MMTTERTATIAVTVSAVLLAIAAAAFAVSGGVAAPTSDELPSIASERPVEPVEPAAPADAVPQVGVDGVPAQDLQSPGAQEAGSAANKSVRSPGSAAEDKDHEVVVPRPRESDDEDEPDHAGPPDESSGSDDDTGD